jgi:hypothetical protein
VLVQIEWREADVVEAAVDPTAEVPRSSGADEDGSDLTTKR